MTTSWASHRSLKYQFHKLLVHHTQNHNPSKWRSNKIISPIIIASCFWGVTSSSRRCAKHLFVKKMLSIKKKGRCMILLMFLNKWHVSTFSVQSASEAWLSSLLRERDFSDFDMSVTYSFCSIQLKNCRNWGQEAFLKRQNISKNITKQIEVKD